MRLTLITAVTGIALLLTQPLQAGGPVISPEQIEGVAEAPPRGSNKALPWIIGGLVVLAIIAGGGSDPCNGPDTTPEPGPVC